jgi:hypothetical protein
MSADNPVLRAALAYVQRFGFAIFRCRAGGKESLSPHRCLQAP